MIITDNKRKKTVDINLGIHYNIVHKKYAPLAQLVEQLTLNQWVPGSSP